MPRPLSQRREPGGLGEEGCSPQLPSLPRMDLPCRAQFPWAALQGEALLSPTSPTSPRHHHAVQEGAKIKVGPITTLPPPPLRLNSSHLWFPVPDLIQHPQLSHSTERNQHFQCPSHPTYLSLLLQPETDDDDEELGEQTQVMSPPSLAPHQPTPHSWIPQFPQRTAHSADTERAAPLLSAPEEVLAGSLGQGRASDTLLKAGAQTATQGQVCVSPLTEWEQTRACSSEGPESCHLSLTS